MNLPRVYTETVIHRAEKSLRWTFLVLPASSAPGKSFDLKLTKKFGFTEVRRIDMLSSLPFLIAAILKNQESEDILGQADRFAHQLMSNEANLSNDDQQILKFAEQLVFGKYVPFRESPLTEESLGSVAASAEDPNTLPSSGVFRFEQDHCIVVANPNGIVIGSPEPLMSKSIWEKIIRWIEGK